MHLKNIILLPFLIFAISFSAYSQSDSTAYSILQKTLAKYDHIDSLSFSCQFTHQILNSSEEWDTLYLKRNQFTAIKGNNQQWYPVISLSRDIDNLTEFYRFRNAIIRSQWAMENHKIRLIENCKKTPLFVFEYWDVPLGLTGGGDSLVRQTIYVDTLSLIITSVQTVVSFNNSEIGLFSFVMDSFDIHIKQNTSKVFQLNKGMLTAGNMAPFFNLKNTANELKTLDDYKGQLLLLDFWYAACKPCIKASVGMENLKKKYAKRGLVVLGMNTMDNATKIKRHNRKHDITYESLLCTSDTKSKYKVKSYPSFYLIDRKGKIVYSSSGYYSGLEKDIELAILQAFSNR